MKINTGKTEIISFTYKINSINFNYKLCKKLVACSQCVKWWENNAHQKD
jgi:hypothetical protein